MAEYKVYEATLTVDTVIDARAAINQYPKGGYIKNDDLANSMGVAFSFGGSTYGDTLTLKAGEQIVLCDFPKFSKIKLVWSANVAYRIVVGFFKTGVE